MTAPFVTNLRVGDEVTVLGDGNGTVLHLRVQAAELWEALRIDAPDTASVLSVKETALEEFFPQGASMPEFVVKVRGFEILDENATLAAAGVKDGSTLLLARRRRRAVR